MTIKYCHPNDHDRVARGIALLQTTQSATWFTQGGQLWQHFTIDIGWSPLGLEFYLIPPSWQTIATDYTAYHSWIWPLTEEIAFQTEIQSGGGDLIKEDKIALERKVSS